MEKKNISDYNLSYIEHYHVKRIRIMSINVLRLWKMNLDNEFHVVTKYLLQFHGAFLHNPEAHLDNFDSLVITSDKAF